MLEVGTRARRAKAWVWGRVTDLYGQGLQSEVRSHPVEAAVRIGHRLAAPLQQLILAITSYKSAFGAKQIARRRVAICRCREGALTGT